MLRQSAFVAGNKMLKGGLHCHTTRSDGQCTPEDTIALHEQNGYDFLSLTDHRLYNYRNFAPGSTLTIIPGMEMDRSIEPVNGIHCFHTVWLGDVDNNPYTQDQYFARGTVRDQHDFQTLLNQAHADNQMTIYCHPQWSSTPAREFEELQGNFAMEIWNSGCALGVLCDSNNGWIWDELLMRGKRIAAVATDDGHAQYQHCKGWVMVNAQNAVGDILRALRQDAFYSSCGPEIHDFYIDDDNVAHIDCSPCAYIRFVYGGCIMSPCRPDEGLITHAQKAVPAYYAYLRAEVCDAQGRMAWTNPLYIR